MLVARRGKIAWTKTLGFRDRAAKDPMEPDSIFRIYSMTKPIVSVAAMMLVEEGRMQISDPVAKYLPEIGKMKVGNETSENGKATLQLTEPSREMTVQDLLRHTSGPDLRHARQIADQCRLYRGEDRQTAIPAMRNSSPKLSKLPLRFSPGERWEYGVSTDVLGRVVEVVSGKTLGEFLNERIFTPLGMADTGFYVPAEKLSRARSPGRCPKRRR